MTRVPHRPAALTRATGKADERGNCAVEVSGREQRAWSLIAGGTAVAGCPSSITRYAPPAHTVPGRRGGGTAADAGDEEREEDGGTGDYIAIQ